VEEILDHLAPGSCYSISARAAAAFRRGLSEVDFSWRPSLFSKRDSGRNPFRSSRREFRLPFASRAFDAIIQNLRRGPRHDYL
jgi:hypothetical protein